MNEEEMQLDLGTDGGTTDTATTGQPDMSDDDMAALLGFSTTLSEQMMNPQEEGADNAQVGDAEQGAGAPAKPSEIEQETPGTPKKDEEQDKEIADIRAQLEQLLAEETNGTETEDTKTA